MSHKVGAGWMGMRNRKGQLGPSLSLASLDEKLDVEILEMFVFWGCFC